MSYFYVLFLCLIFIIILKIGLFPFHIWYLRVGKNLSWNRFFLLRTIQKLIPLQLCSFFYNNILLFIAFINTILRVILIWYFNDFRSILIISSISHISWIILRLYLNINFSYLYIIIYIIIIYIIINKLHNNLINLFQLKYLHKRNKNNIIIRIFSLSGVPPFIGFIIKLIILNIFMCNNLYLLRILLILTRFIFIYNYLKTLYPIIFIKRINNFYSEKNKNIYFYNILLIPLIALIF